MGWRGQRSPCRWKRYLRARTAQLVPAEQAEAWQRAFVEVMAVLANHYAPKELHEQRTVFHLFGGSFERALALTEAAGELVHYAALLQALAAYALNRRNLPLAQQRFAALAATNERQGREDWAAGAYHHLGMVAQERRDFAATETVLLVSAVLVALQTHVRFERDKEGKWTLKIEKKPTDTRLLKELIKKLISWN